MTILIPNYEDDSHIQDDQQLDPREPPRFYMSSVEPPTSVINILTGSLTENILNAVIVRSQTLEICRVGHDGLRSLKSSHIFGSILFSRLIKLPKENFESIFIVTEKYDVMILEYIEEQNILKTRACGNIDTEHYQKEESPLIAIDGTGQCVVIQMYKGILSLINLSETNTHHLYSYRGEKKNSELSNSYLITPMNIVARSIFLDQPNLVSLEFVYNDKHNQDPSLVCLVEYYDGSKNIKTYSVNLNENRLEENVWSRALVDKGSSLIIPSNSNKYHFMVIGREVISYYTPESLKSPVNPEKDEMICKPSNKLVSLARILNICQIDKGRFIFGDDNGRLFILALLDEQNEIWSTDKSDQKLNKIRIEILGQSVVSRSIAYLDNSVLLIAADQGDSEVVRIAINKQKQHKSTHGLKNSHSKKSLGNNSSSKDLQETLSKETNFLYNDVYVPGTCLEKIELITNIGPIVDSLLLDSDSLNGAQCQMLTCSGEEHDGSLRILKSGIGINEKLMVEFEELHKVFALNIFDSGVTNGSSSSDEESSDFDNEIMQPVDSQNFLDNDNSKPVDGLTMNDEESTNEQEKQILVKQKIEPEHNCLLISFSQTSRLFKVGKRDICEIFFEGLVKDEKTLACFHVVNNCIIQVSRYGAHLIDESGKRLDSYVIDNDKKAMIDFGSKISDNALLISSGKKLLKLEITKSQTLKLEHTKVYDSDIACICSNAELVAVGLWGEYLDVDRLEDKRSNRGSYFELLRADNLDLINEINLANKSVVRSCLISVSYKYNKIFLLISMGDGTIFTWEVLRAEENQENSPVLTAMAESVRFPIFDSQAFNPNTDPMSDSVMIPSCMTSSTFSNDGKPAVDKAYSYTIKKISSPMRTVCSTSPTMLSNIKLISADNEAINHVFASSDQPAVLSYNRYRLNANSVNIKNVKNCLTFNSKNHPSSIIVYNDSNILLGTIDSLQKIHIKTKALFESPKKIRFYKERHMKHKSSQEVPGGNSSIAHNEHYVKNKLLLATERKIHSYNTPLDYQENKPISSKADSVVRAENYRNVKNSSDNLGSRSGINGKNETGDGPDSDNDGFDHNSQNPIDFENVECNLLFIDEQSFNVELAYRLPINEMILSLETVQISKYKPKDSDLNNLPKEKNSHDSTKNYIIMGTAIYNPDEPEPSLGRIHVLELVAGRLNIVTTKCVEGAVYDIKALDNGKLVAGVNSSVIVYNFKNNIDLQAECRFYNNIIVLSLDVVKNLIYVGDILRSVALIEYNGNDASLTEIARDYNPRQAAAIKAIDYHQEDIVEIENKDNTQDNTNPSQTEEQSGNPDENPIEDNSDLSIIPKEYSPKVYPQICMLVDGDNDLLCMQRRHMSGDVEKQIQLQSTAQVHLGTSITSIIPGSLVMNDTIKNHPFLYKHSDNTWLMTGNSGAILSLLRVSNEVFSVLEKIQETVRNKAMSKFPLKQHLAQKQKDGLGLELTSIGGIDHSDWRACKQYVKTPEYDYVKRDSISQIGKTKERGIIDGDLLENLMSLRREDIHKLFPEEECEIMYQGKVMKADEIIKMIEELSRLH